MPTHQSAAPRQRVHHGVHEIRHDGFRIIARKDSNCVRLYSRAGNDRRLLLQLLLSGVNLFRMNLIAGSQLGHRRLLPQRLQGDLRL